MQLGQRLEAHDSRTQRIDPDLLVEGNDRRPVADLLLEVGEEREPLLVVELAAGRLLELGQLRLERRPVDQGDGGPVAHVVDPTLAQAFVLDMGAVPQVEGAPHLG